MVLCAIIGRLGAGKTLFLTKEGYHFHKDRRYNLFTNYHLNYLDHLQLENAEQLIPIGLYYKKMRKFSAIDEGYLWFDALQKSSNKQQFYRNLINITRKMHYVVYFTSQSIGQLYYRMRILFDFVIKPEYNKRKHIMKTEIYRPNMFGEYEYIGKLKVSNMDRYYPLYDTDEIINDFILEYNNDSSLLASQFTPQQSLLAY